MRGYKVFNPDWTCKDFQYEVGKIYEIDEEPIICRRGFHFCKKLNKCFNYYEFNLNNKVAEIEALGKIVEKKDKSCTNKIKIVRELSWSEVLDLVNTGDYNSGYDNSGDYNIGHHNTGGFNSGNYNSGDYNSGDCNSGDYNSGIGNSGRENSGNCNAGDCNSGYDNSGNYNSGNCNAGNYNSGNYNSGDYNSGDYNSGYYNSGDYNSGVFNTEKEPKIKLFNKSSNWTMRNWIASKAKNILRRMPKDNCRENRQIWWDELSQEDKKEVMNLPNFDKKVFEDITGIKVNLND